MPSIATRLFRGTRAILKYKKERDILVDNIRRHIVTLRQLPKGNYLFEVTLNIQSLKIQADKMKWASQDLATNAADMNFVASKGVDYYATTIPQICDDVGRHTRQMYEILLNHIHRPVANTEREIAQELEHALANLGYILDSPTSIDSYQY
ncbi:hypothetical protein N7491_002614 [Penicillium cf. griseofulvum]|uniref:Uncharacterized protein n=1 Tax=Penicillium cf. griseofulvum TaxID=2972120 RepID=A0A9W9MSL1_9EURO|nr:hypothetical protein N7472_003205 [Penicillium cf. griseofulvum]KAJ5446532.1 hypothetical protein N7491_002614 [Penicillium cf. griseofulvum]KAJ5448271.1 hypothetical protein N7445_003092 [Penicillium cf. griseofulvum]